MDYYKDSPHNMVTKKIIINAFTADVHQVDTGSKDDDSGSCNAKNNDQEQACSEGIPISTLFHGSSLSTNTFTIMVR